jgi:hypothetical protein
VSEATKALAGQASCADSAPTRSGQSGPRGATDPTSTDLAAPKDAFYVNAKTHNNSGPLPAGINPPAVFKRRTGQREFIRGVEEHRLAGLLARRQYGKTTIASQIALRKMMKRPGHTVVFGSVKIDLGREIVRKEAEAMQKAITALIAEAQRQSKNAKMLDVVDAESRSGASVLNLKADDFAELYEAQRLEFRLHHSQTVYSRTKVVALTPAAVGETGDLILDEVGRVKNFREVWEAVKPIISSNPEFRCMLTTTPPPDDGHYSFELLAPPVGTSFAANPKGNWYKSELGIWVLRIDAWDAFADGVPLYDDDTGAPISPEEARRRDHDKQAWDRNYGVQFLLGGTTAVGLLQLNSAQARSYPDGAQGEPICKFIFVDSEADFEDGLEFLAANIGPGPVGLGWDLATTEKQTSNPSSISVVERDGVNLIAPVIFAWKTAEPRVAKLRARRIIETINARTEGGRVRRLCIDATNERYFATECQQEFARLCQVELVIQSETIGGANGNDAEKRGWVTVPNPSKEPIKVKTYLGNRLVAAFDDNQITIPADAYVKNDIRSVKKERGAFEAELGPNGEHGDVFDGLKLGLHAVDSTGGAITTVEGVRIGARGGQNYFKPARLLPGAMKGVRA